MDIAGNLGENRPGTGTIWSPENGGKNMRTGAEIRCKGQDQASRFLIPLALTSENRKGKISFHGRENWVKEPLDTYYRIFDEQDKIQESQGLL